MAAGIGILVGIYVLAAFALPDPSIRRKAALVELAPIEIDVDRVARWCKDQGFDKSEYGADTFRIWVATIEEVGCVTEVNLVHDSTAKVLNISYSTNITPSLKPLFYMFGKKSVDMRLKSMNEDARSEFGESE